MIVDERAGLLYRVIERAIEMHNEEAAGETAGGPGSSRTPRIIAHMATFDTRNRLALHRTCTVWLRFRLTFIIMVWEEREKEITITRFTRYS